jgi:hypothetical protein
VYEAISIEGMNKPTVTLVNKGFYNDAISAASSKGWPGMRIVPETVPCEGLILEQIDSGVGAAMNDVVEALTRPLTTEEKSPQSREPEKLSRIIFKGSLEEVNRFFYQRGWADGLPIIPPTEEAVTEMLTGTNLPPDHIVEKIIPRLGKATIEKIAINAVMAGALPTYMPILIAGVQAVMEPESRFGGMEVSTGSVAPFWVINGPIRNDLHINSGSGALSPGDIANAAIGRAMGLIIKNIGGARKGVEDMGTMGNPGKYSMVVAENEEESPWEPLHVERGFKKEDSTVTVSFVNSFSTIMPSATNDEGVLDTLIENLSPVRRRAFCLMMTPQHASYLAKWTKKDMANYIAEHTPAPSVPPLTPFGPIDNRFIVAGGAGNWMLLLNAAGGVITKKVQLPQNWDKIVAKYKNIVPTYSRY